MDLGLTGRSALVCGASKGLGYACAEALAREGVRVTLVARDEAALTDAAGRIAAATGSPAANFVVADLSQPSGRAQLKGQVAAADILITNCGGPPAKDFTQLSEGDWIG